MTLLIHPRRNTQTTIKLLALASHVMNEWPIVSVLRTSPEERLIPWTAKRSHLRCMGRSGYGNSRPLSHRETLQIRPRWIRNHDGVTSI